MTPEEEKRAKARDEFLHDVRLIVIKHVGRLDRDELLSLLASLTVGGAIADGWTEEEFLETLQKIAKVAYENKGVLEAQYGSKED